MKSSKGIWGYFIGDWAQGPEMKEDGPGASSTRSCSREMNYDIESQREYHDYIPERSDKEMIRDVMSSEKEIESYLLNLRDDKGCYSKKFHQFIPLWDWKSRRWLKTRNSVYGIVIGHALHCMVLDSTVLIRGFLYCFQQAILVGIIQFIILHRLFHIDRVA